MISFRTVLVIYRNNIIVAYIVNLIVHIYGRHIYNIFLLIEKYHCEISWRSYDSQQS